MNFVSILMILIIALLFLLLVGFIFVWFKAAAAQVAANNRQPILSVSAQVVTKRHDTWRRRWYFRYLVLCKFRVGIWRT